ncbi:MAG: hypothetical protein PHR00_00775 [Patescibacteria group bacterium]|nr:hypothetical protein [Patescibacteria group bacterium]
MEKSPSIVSVVAIFENVLIEVPGLNARWRAGLVNTVTKNVQHFNNLEEAFHYKASGNNAVFLQLGQVVGKKIILNKFFYISEEKIGKKITATIEVQSKYVPDKGEFIYLNIKPTDTKPEYELKIHGLNDSKGIRYNIPGTTSCIDIIPLEKANK